MTTARLNLLKLSVFPSAARHLTDCSFESQTALSQAAGIYFPSLKLLTSAFLKTQSRTSQKYNQAQILTCLSNTMTINSLETSFTRNIKKNKNKTYATCGTTSKITPLPGSGDNKTTKNRMGILEIAS